VIGAIDIAGADDLAHAAELTTPDEFTTSLHISPSLNLDLPASIDLAGADNLGQSVELIPDFAVSESLNLSPPLDVMSPSGGSSLVGSGSLNLSPSVGGSLNLSPSVGGGSLNLSPSVGDDYDDDGAYRQNPSPTVGGGSLNLIPKGSGLPNKSSTVADIFRLQEQITHTSSAVSHTAHPTLSPTKVPHNNVADAFWMQEKMINSILAENAKVVTTAPTTAQPTPPPTIYRQENERYTSMCSHVHCKFHERKQVVQVHHHREETYGNKHLCKHGLHVEGKVSDLNLFLPFTPFLLLVRL
jgi:hypothetical protein